MMLGFNLTLNKYYDSDQVDYTTIDATSTVQRK